MQYTFVTRFLKIDNVKKSTVQVTADVVEKQ